MIESWPHFKRIGKYFYVHMSNYFTTVKREAERKAKMWDQYEGMSAKVVHRRIKGGDGKVRTVYTVYTRNEKEKS